MANEARPFIGKYKYKYMPYGDGVKALIKNATMKFSHANEFNDPFDCVPSYSEESIHNISNVTSHLIREFSDSLGLSPSQRIQNKGKFAKTLQNHVYSGEYLESIQNGVGICSMTTKPCNLLMWAHYGNKHTGIAAEFKSVIPQDDSLGSKYLFAVHIKYQNDKPVREIYKSDVTHDLLIKGEDWNYEDEIRVLDFDRGNGIHPYERQLLSSIILGVKFDEKLKSEIKELISKVNEEHGMNIKLYQAEIVPNKFKIYIPEHPVYGSSNWSYE